MALGPVKLQSTVRFGEDFEFDLQSYKLRREGRVLKLERIPMEILLFLVEQKGQIVTREQIASRIWGKDVFLDTDNSINGAIRKIRQVLRDDSEQPHFIQTVTGSGYRFIAPVSSDGHGSAGVIPDVLLPQPPPTPKPETFAVRPDRKKLGRKARVLFAGLTIIVMALVGSIVWSRLRTEPRASGKIMLAVLPFENLTGDANQEYFSDGLTEEMITQLGNLDPQQLGVIARASVMHYKSSRAPLDTVRRELSVQYVIEGSVRRDANHIRITAQLIKTKDQTHVWAREYDRELSGLLGLQTEIAHEIADEIQVTLGDHKPTVSAPALSPHNYEAYDLYLKGQYFLNKRDTPDLEEAAHYLQLATVKDPNYARAYAELAGCYALMGGYTEHPQSELIPKARAAALRALQIDDNLAEAHTALALIVQNYDWDWQTAEREFRRAIDLNPNYATAHHWYAEQLMWRGRFDEALQESERARQLDPLSLIIAADNGAILYYSRQYERSIAKFRSVLDMDPNFPRAHLIRGPYVEKGMFAQALADTESLRPHAQLSVYWHWHWAWRAYMYGREGKTAQAKQALQELLQRNQKQRVDPMVFAWAYAGLKDRGNTMTWLEKGCAQHSTGLLSVKVEPAFDFVRDDPRFQDLLQRVGLGR